MMMKKSILACLLSCMFVFTSCGESNGSPVPDPNPEPGIVSNFAKGADVSWLTEMEGNGIKFYDKFGNERECMGLLKELGVNSIRLRVWVNPEGGWNGKQDVLAKAKRASALGMKLMIDFHYSDSWADPSKQTKPAEWVDYDLEQLKQAVASHTTDVLQTLKDNGIDVSWVQVGNETSGGMLWETGRAEGSNFGNFAQLLNSGYDAVKGVYPDAKVIVHLNNGQDLQMYTWMFNGLRDNGARWDVIGMSLYPEDDNWRELTDQCLNNMKTLVGMYDKDVVLCEIGMSWDSPYAVTAIGKMMDGCKETDRCLGLFYWEPECYNGWSNYTKGAFDNNGKPTAVMSVFN